jgi:alpha/beta superfamily hydrolase
MFDFQGYGLSDGPPGTSMGYWEKLDVHGAVDWLLGRGETRFASFGISMGAVIMIMVTANMLTRVENAYILYEMAR